MKNYYQLLQIKQTATVEEIKKAYRDLAAILHPDKQTDEKKAKTAEEQFKLINEAHEILSDENKRFLYDSELKSSSKSAKTPIKKNFEIFGFSFSQNELQIVGLLLFIIVFFIGLFVGNNKKALFS